MKRLAELKERFKAVLEEYGTIALVVHFSLFGAVLLGFWIAIEMGFKPEGMAAGTGTLVAAYAGSQLTKPFRLAAVVFLTPIIAAFLRRRRGDEEPEPEPAPE